MDYQLRYCGLPFRGTFPELLLVEAGLEYARRPPMCIRSLCSSSPWCQRCDRRDHVAGREEDVDAGENWNASRSTCQTLKARKRSSLLPNKTLSDLLELSGAADISAARRLHESRNAARDAVKRLKNDLKDVAPEGLASLEAALADLPKAQEELPDPDDLETLSHEVATTENALARIESQHETSRGGVASQRQKRTVFEAQIEGFENQLKELDAVLDDHAEQDKRATERTH